MVLQRNQTMLQGFEWHSQSEPPGLHETHSLRSHYSRLTRMLDVFAGLGFTSLWLPPGCKANNPRGNGYDCYDFWDLGEFDQKGARSTKWGSREELDDLLQNAKGLGIDIVWDAVLNHKTGGDAIEEAWAVEVDADDRRYEICPPKKIEAWLRFDFPGRGRERERTKGSKLRWQAEHFTGTDWDHKERKKAIYKLIDDPSQSPITFKQPQRPPSKRGERRPSGPGRTPSSLYRWVTKFSRARTENKADVPGPARRPGKGWAEDVDMECGNNDYLMFSNIDHGHAEVREDLLEWGQWMLGEVGVEGFRLDAAQHFSFSFTRDWIVNADRARKTKGHEGLFVVGEVWTGEVSRILHWIDSVQSPSGPQVYAYDSPLVYNFSRISEDVRNGSPYTDLTTISRESLLAARPQAAVTLVTNHDTQPGQTSYTPMLRELKLLFYAYILLRKDGLPCVFWGDLFGTEGPQAEEPACVVDRGDGKERRNLLADLVKCRRLYAHGMQTDYLQSKSCLSWTRSGTIDRSGCAVILHIGPGHALPMLTRAFQPQTSDSPRQPNNNNNVTSLKMRVGSPGEIWTDVLQTERDEAIVDEEGFASFRVSHESAKVSVYVRKDAHVLEIMLADMSSDA